MATSGPSTSEDAAAAWYCPSCEREYPTSLGACPGDGTRLVRVTDRDPFLGQVLDGRFVIRERLGAGGMGVVYRAWQTSVGREVAVKVIRMRAGNNVALVKRFLREAKLSSQLSQPATVAVIDFGQTEDGTLYLVMELLRGRTLGEVLAGRALAPERAVRIAVQICDALEAAHRAGIIHRDLKPANVMILDEPVGRDATKVLDFGLAKAIDSDESSVTQSGKLVGTPTHLAPEVATGGDATPQSDLYALGVMLHEMLAGSLPFSTADVSTMIMMHAYQSAPPLGAGVPPALAAIVAQLLAKPPSARPASAAVLRAQLEAAIAPGASALAVANVAARAARAVPADQSASDETRELGVAHTTPATPVTPASPAAPALPPTPASTRARAVLIAMAVGAVVLAAVVGALLALGVGPFARVRAAAVIDAAAIDAAVIDGAASVVAEEVPIDAGVLHDAAPPLDASRDRRPTDARERPRPDGGARAPLDGGARPTDAGTRPPIDSGTGWVVDDG